jgi:hypothetical protein
MSREHHQSCIPSRIMSPWLSSAFAMSTDHQPLSHPPVAEPPQKLVIVVGIWLIFGTTALMAIAGVFALDRWA